MPDEQRETLFKRLSPAEEQGRIRGGAKLVEASRIVAGSHRTGTTHKSPEPVNRKERTSFNQKVRLSEEIILEDWAKQTGCWRSYNGFEKDFGARKIGEGAEALVYLSNDGITVLKVNDGIFHGTWLEFFDRIAIHNTLFPETTYTLIGFTQRKGFYGEDRLAAIVKQAFIKTDRGATFNEVKANMELIGFLHLKRDDYYNPETGIIIEDLHDENVLVDKDLNLIYIDPAIFLEQPEMNLAGNRIIRL